MQLEDAKIPDGTERYPPAIHARLSYGFAPPRGGMPRATPAVIGAIPFSRSITDR
jgi:hypothetical protein